MSDYVLQVETSLPTALGNFKILAYATSPNEPQPDIVLVSEKKSADKSAVLVRIHSECMTGDVFHSLRCDCGEQLDYALKKINEEGGVLIYLRQEGRGIGLINKLKAYKLQDSGLDTIEANKALGFADDERHYQRAAKILSDLKIQKVRLLTNNPLKITELEKLGLEVAGREPIVISPRTENERYLNTKKFLMGHLV
jgi:3,4-dihydroxy 2-butanone 4-phosphate synthase/GTP cyclohydrolase II